MRQLLYNDNDPFVCAWLRELMAAGALPQGVIDGRSITELEAGGIPATFHAFAGIGGWPYAMRVAGIPDDFPIWTASCPCQPVSCAGQRKGHEDQRHLWPALYALIAQCRPPVIVGEQVASKDGREWFAGVRADLEELGYACGGADMCAASVSAPHIRQRIYWCAIRLGDSGGERRQQIARGASADEGKDGRGPDGDHVASGAGATDWVAYRNEAGCGRVADEGLQRQPVLYSDGCGAVDGVAVAQHAERRPFDLDGQDGRNGADGGRAQAYGESGACGEVQRVAVAKGSDRGTGKSGIKSTEGIGRRGLGGNGAVGGLEQSPSDGRDQRGTEPEWGSAEPRCATGGLGNAERTEGARQRPDCGRLLSRNEEPNRSADTAPWTASRFIRCRDRDPDTGEYRWRRIPAEPAFFPLAPGLPTGRVGILRGAGNAIVAPLAAQFLQVVMELLD